MVRTRETLLFLVVLEQRKVDDPNPGEFGRRLELEIFRHLEAQLAENFVDDFRFVRGEGEEIAFLRAGALDELLRDGLKELRDAGVEAARGHLRDGQALGAEALCPFGQRVGFLARELSAAGDGDRTSPSARLEDARNRSCCPRSVTSNSSMPKRRSGDRSRIGASPRRTAMCGIGSGTST
jgi:hypothetical protein